MNILDKFRWTLTGWRHFMLLGFFLLAARIIPAVDFYGATICRDHATTSVQIPDDSGLRLASVEVGDEGGLLMLLYAEEGEVLEQLDLLISRVTGSAGTQEGDSMQWSGGKLVAFASRIKKGTVAVAISSNDSCPEEPALIAPESGLPRGLDTDSGEAMGAAAGIDQQSEARHDLIKALPVPSDEHAGEIGAVEVETDFRLEGELKYSQTIPPWVDVMGLVRNNSGTAYRLAAFDLSLYDLKGDLLCAGTVSIGVLKAGQAHAFRDSIKCPDVDPGEISGYRFQFSGGY